MHICCANCSLYPVQTLKQRGVEIRGYWYNPNIHPFTEYTERLKSVRMLEEMWHFDIDYNDDYGLTEFVRNVAGKEDERCDYCYDTRLEQTARKAKDDGMEAFTTSLLVSPYQNTGKIIEKGTSLAAKYNIEFLAEDFRPGYRDGMSISRELGLYRQKYCGCIYSEMERYSGKK